MLRDLLLEIKDSKYISKANIAFKLNLPMELIEDGFEQLIRMGYIVEDDGLSPCSTACGSCPYASACNKMPVKTMKITKKGEKLLEKSIA